MKNNYFKKIPLKIHLNKFQLLILFLQIFYLLYNRLFIYANKMALLCTKSLKLNKFHKLINIETNKTLNKYFSSTKFYLNVDKAAASAKPAPIPPPHFEGDAKVYPTKIQNLVNEISKLTLIEVSDLNELLRKTLNIKDVPMYSGVASAPASGAAAAAEAKKAADKKDEAEADAAPVVTKSSFKLKLVKFDDAKKVALIKEIKGLNENMNLVQAKKFIESVPQVFRDNIGKDDAEKLKAQLEKVGATCVIEQNIEEKKM